ncbi:hypothetical protein LJ739_17505 [Aestuariibacter halophilus]|uniref:Orphan protein n=1 Tax=Fluctibacter halophilus TaxID=226011 RepID=A0ABS8GBU4_9ALTE|nr:hypothetical protein [Aestuariibacter halophilus]MCC2618055.1 hypothetical protein [Aestuariibacter halophilus]
MTAQRLPLYKKLTVTFRVEPGCLGPDGKDHIEAFCRYAKNAVAPLHNEFVRWVITPRYDKSLPETEYKTNGKRLSAEQAAQYLGIFEQSLSEFEEHLEEQLSELIDDFHGR